MLQDMRYRPAPTDGGVRGEAVRAEYEHLLHRYLPEAARDIRSSLQGQDRAALDMYSHRTPVRGEVYCAGRRVVELS